MSVKQHKYIIVGGGLVAGYAARVFADNDAGDRGRLCILSADIMLPYERPALSKQFLAGEESASEILINEPDFYARNGIDIQLETTVERINFADHLVHTQDQIFGYDSLLIATGARPKGLQVPGFDLEGVHTLRQINDAVRIRRACADADQAVVIGGSFIGMEVGSVLQREGVRTTIVFPESRVWEAFFTPEMSRFFEAYYRDQGVEFVREAAIQRFTGTNGHVTGVVLASGRELPANLVVAGVGVEPNVEIVRDSPLQIDDGIIVNRFLETNQRGVFAAGDVARYRDPRTDQLRRIEHWSNAKNQGEHVARGMLGMRHEYDHVPYFFSDVFDLSYEFWGDTSGATTVINRGAVDEGRFSSWWLDDGGRLVAAFVMNRPEEEREVAPDWIAERRELDPGLLRSSASLLGATVMAA